MLSAMLLAALAAGAVLGANEAPAEAPALLHSTEQWRLLKTQLATEEKKLASVEKMHSKTVSQLSEKTAQSSTVEDKLKRVQELNEQLKQAEAAKDEALQEARSLRQDKLFAKGSGTAVLLSVQQSMDQELEEAEAAAAQQRTAELLAADAQAKKYRSDIHKMKEQFFTEGQELERSKRQARPLMKAEEQELNGAAMLQEQLATRKTGERVTRAMTFAQEEQEKVLQKQQELARLKYDIGNGTIMLEMKKGQLKAEAEHAEVSAKEATAMTDRLATTESLLRTAHQQVGNLSMTLVEKSHETEGIEKSVHDLQKFAKKDADDAEKTLANLQKAQEDAEAKFAELTEKVNETEGTVNDTMDQIKLQLSASKETAEANTQRIQLEKAHAEEQAKEDQAQYEAALSGLEVKKAELKSELEEVESEAVSEKKEAIKHIMDENSNVSFIMLEHTAKANLKAQQRRNKAESDKYNAARGRLQTQIAEAQKSAQTMLEGSAGDMATLHQAITKSHAMEASTMIKVNKQMEEMMKHTTMLKEKFEKEDAKIDGTRRKAADFGRRIQKVEKEVEAMEAKYEATKRSAVTIFKVLEKGEQLNVSEVQEQAKALKAEHVHKERTVGELVQKLESIRAEVELLQKQKEEAAAQALVQKEKEEKQRQEADKLQKAQDSLEDLQDEFDSIETERPDLDSGPDPSVQALLQEVTQLSTPAPSFIQTQDSAQRAKKSKFLRAQKV